MIKLIIEGKPFSVNQTYKTARGRKMYMSNEAKSYGDSVGLQAKAQFKGRPLSYNLEVTYYYYFSHNRVFDHLNFNKILNDRLNQIVWKDDKQIKISHHYTLYDKENPRIELIIKKLKVKSSSPF